MALVAYSDDSDFSEGEETFDGSGDLQKEHVQAEEEIPKLMNVDMPAFQLPSAIPTPQKPLSHDSQWNISEDSDVVDDVPTVKTWGMTKNLTEKKSQCLEGGIPKKKNEQSSVVNKLRIILPALSEFDEEEENENLDEENRRKKIRPSSGGTGLFAILPKPKNCSSLVPQSVKKRSYIEQSKTKKKEVLTTTRDSKVDSDEEDILKSSDTSDFFSLTDSSNALPTHANNAPSLFPSNINPQLSPPLQKVLTTTEDQLPSASNREEAVASPPLFIPFSHSDETSAIHGIEEEALRRLAGGRNKGEVPTIIDIKADDALMSREEWVSRALCDEKPKKSFSTKKDGNPTQQQKRKHQITYLAHQAQERENDLQNNWGQNRYTKIQTRSKYGF